MKVLHILQSNRFSGAENVVCQIISMFKAEEGVEMVYCSRDGQIREALAERGVRFVPISKLSAREIKRVIREENPDVIHAHDRSASLMASLATKKVPIVAHMHVNNNKGLSLMLKNLIWTLRAGRFSHIFWVSDSSFRGFQFHGVLKGKSSVLYNVMSREETLRKADVSPAYPNYDAVYVGRLTHQKHPERLMKVLHEACRRRADFRAAIAGDGVYAEYVRNYIADNGLSTQIDYLGYADQPLGLMRGSKALLMTSRFEGTPMVAIESQILGTPIVSTPADGMCDLIENGVNGYLSEDDEELVCRLLEIVEDGALREKLSAGCEKKAEPLTDIDGFAQKIYAAYQK